MASDDAEVVYWTLAIEGTPAELCPQHPSYLSPTEIVFSAYRCFGASCTCAT